MGFKKVAGMMVSAAVQAPRIFGALSPFLYRVSPKGNTLIDTAMKGDIKGVLTDAREVLGGIDDNGKLQTQWLVDTWTPVIIGDVATRGLQFIRKVLSEALS